MTHMQLRRAAEALRTSALDDWGWAVQRLTEVRAEFNARGVFDEIVDGIDELIGTARYEMEGAVEDAEIDAADAYGDFRRDQDHDR